MQHRLLLRLALFLLLVCLLSAGAAGQGKRRTVRRPVAVAGVVRALDTTTPGGRRQEAFLAAWSTLSEQYYDKTFGGLDWEKIRTEYLKRVKATRTDLEFHRILEEMIGRLGRSHLSIIVPEYFERIETAKRQARAHERQMAAKRRAGTVEKEEEPGPDKGDAGLFGDGNWRYGIGVELRTIDGRIVITNVEKQSGAAIAGLKPGFVIEKINGVVLADVIRDGFINGSTEARMRDLLPLQIVESFLNGEPETSVQLTCSDGTGTAKDYAVPRLALVGQTVSISQYYPEQFLRYEAASLGDDVGYIKFNAFAVPVIDKFCDSLSKFNGKKALIVDLRGNLGGILGSMFGLAGMLTAEELTMGKYVARHGSETFMAASKAKNFKGRIVVLVDHLSMSAAEIFTAGLQQNGRVVVVGERTGGQTLPAVWTRLSTGAVMVYPIADFITPKGTSLEGVGLEPDHAVALDRQALLKGVDTQLEKALMVARDNTAPARPSTPKLTALGKILPEPPPPPPPIRKAAPGGLSTAAPPPPMILKRIDAAAPLQTTPSDARSLKVIADFKAVIGGTDALKDIKTYEAGGTMATGRNFETQTDVYAARQFPDKSLMVFASPSLGEIREIYNGKTAILQSDLGIERPLFPGIDTTRVHLFAPVFNTLDPTYLNSLKYEGEYDIHGRMRHLLSGKNPEGLPVGLSFDSESKLLVVFSLPGMLYNLSDYRKVDGRTLPFQIELDRIYNLKLTTLKLNPSLDPSSFEKKEKCFDKAN